MLPTPRREPDLPVPHVFGGSVVRSACIIIPKPTIGICCRIPVPRQGLVRFIAMAGRSLVTVTQN
jgi:hypothetical protein